MILIVKILIGGSPCTHWSVAQKNNRETEAEGVGWELFKNYIIAKEKFQPDLFLYENNKSAAQPIKDQIAKELGVGTDINARFTYINSALVSAQNRQRFYVTNFGDIEQPKDREILLKNILENGQVAKDKAYCLKHQMGNVRDHFKKHHTDIAFMPVCVAERGRYIRDNQETAQRFEARKDGKTNTLTTVLKDNNIAEPVEHGNPRYLLKNFKTENDKSNTLTASCYKGIGSDGMITISEPVRVGDLPNEKGLIGGSKATRIYNIKGNSVNLIANGGGQGTKTGLNATPIEFDKNIPIKAISNADCKTYPVYCVANGKITIKEKQYPIKLEDGYYIIRKLTVKECCRLQTMPDDYCNAVSATQAYKGLGNGWTAEVIIYLLNHALKDISVDEEIVFYLCMME